MKTKRIPHPDNSDITNPCRWFGRFITKNKPYSFLDDYFKEAKAKHQGYIFTMLGDSSYSYVTHDSDGEFTLESGEDYTDYLEGIIESEKRKSIKLIKEKVALNDSVENVSFIVKSISDQLSYFLSMLKEKNKGSIGDFPCIANGIYGIVEHLELAYKSFLPLPMPAIFAEAKETPSYIYSNLKDFPSKADQSEVEEKKRDTEVVSVMTADNGDLDMTLKVKHFKWKNNPKLYSTNLYHILIELGIIYKSETDIFIFEEAFNGKEIKAPLNIKWHLKNNRNSFKVPIIRMLNYLIHELKILKKAESNADYARKVENTFMGSDGTKLTATEVTMQNMGKHLSYDEKEMIAKLKNITIN